MKKLTVGVFTKRENAEQAIDYIHSKLDIDTDEISYLYRDPNGNVREGDPTDVTTTTTGEAMKTGAGVGATVGVLAGIAAVAGVIPVIGPLVVAGPLASALGFTTAVGTTAAGAVAGAAAGVVAGGIIGALTNMGVSEESAQKYSDRIKEGDLLVTVHSDKEGEVVRAFEKFDAVDINSYKPAM